MTGWVTSRLGSVRRDRLVLLLLLLGVFGVFLVVQRGVIASYDGKVMVGVVVCAMALTVNVASVWLGNEASWNSSTNAHGDSGPAASVILKRQEHAYFYSFAGSSVGYNLERPHTPYWALRNFRGGPNLAGIAGLVLAVGGITGALACAGRRPEGELTGARQTEAEVLSMT